MGVGFGLMGLEHPAFDSLLSLTGATAAELSAAPAASNAAYQVSDLTPRPGNPNP